MVVVHIEKSCTTLDEDPSVVTAYCGAQGFIWEDTTDGGIDPADFDYVIPPRTEQADCAKCIAAYTINAIIGADETPHDEEEGDTKPVRFAKADA